jgi:hypothetical protein
MLLSVLGRWHNITRKKDNIRELLTFPIYITFDSGKEISPSALNNDPMSKAVHI